MAWRRWASSFSVTATERASVACPPQGGLDAGRWQPLQPVAVSVEGHALHVVLVLPDDGAHQGDGDAHAHQVVDTLVDPGEALLHAAHSLVHFVIGAVEGDFRLPGRATFQQVQHFSTNEGSIRLQGEKEPHLRQGMPDFRELRVEQRFSAGDTDPGGSRRFGLLRDAQPLFGGELHPVLGGSPPAADGRSTSCS